MANFVYLTVVFIILLALGMFWHKLLRLTPEEGVALGIMSVMLVIFFVGLRVFKKLRPHFSDVL